MDRALDSVLEAGLGRADITAFEKGMALLGWGRVDRGARDVAAPLHARALFVRDPRSDTKWAHVTADLCFIPAALRVAVLERLASRLDPHEVVLTATHTHSGPSGISHAFFYDLAGPGFSPRVFSALASGIARAVMEAMDRAEPVTLSASSVHIPRSEPVAFNRSLDAFERNREARGQRWSPDAATNRRLRVIGVRERSGRLVGALAFFAVHGTALHGDRCSVHPDVHGLAAEALESQMRARGASSDFVAIVGQGAAGDVTPNHRFDARRGFEIGRFDDDERSAAFVAHALATAAAHALGSAGRALGAPIASLVRHVDLERCEGATRAQIGLAMAAGTAEGPGPLAVLGRVGAALARRGGDATDPKRVLLDVGSARSTRLLSRFDPSALPSNHPQLAHARRVKAEGGLGDEAWIPTVLPFSLLRVGDLLIAGLPFEPTTMAGARLGQRLLAHLEPAGLRDVFVQGYTNAYAGYLTTPEEYAAQRYEGAYTIFGPRSLELVDSILRGLADDLSSDARPPLGPRLPIASARALSVRRWRPEG